MLPSLIAEGYNMIRRPNAGIYIAAILIFLEPVLFLWLFYSSMNTRPLSPIWVGVLIGYFILKICVGIGLLHLKRWAAIAGMVLTLPAFINVNGAAFPVAEFLLIWINFKRFLPNDHD